MQSPILGLVPQSRSTALKDRAGVRLRDKDEGSSTSSDGHDQREPSSPSPAKMGLHYKAADDRTSHGSNKGDSSEDRHGDTSVHRTPEIDKGAADDD